LRQIDRQEREQRQGTLPLDLESPLNYSLKGTRRIPDLKRGYEGRRLDKELHNLLADLTLKESRLTQGSQQISQKLKVFYRFVP